jgi:hypothetical protein
MEDGQGGNKLQEERLEALRTGDVTDKGISIPIGILLLCLSIGLASAFATFVNALAPGFSLAGLASGSGGGGGWGIIVSLVILFAYFLFLIVIPAGLGMIGQRWGFTLGISYILIVMFFLWPYFWFGNNIDKYIPGYGSLGADIAIGLIVVIVATLAGFKSYARNRMRGTKPLVYLRHPAATTLPVLALCGLIAITAPSTVPSLHGKKTTTISLPAYGFSIVEDINWDFKKGYEDRVDYLGIHEVAAWFGLEKSGFDVRRIDIVVYDSMPFTAQPFSSFDSDQKVYSELRRIFEERKQYGGDQIVTLDKGESEIAGKRCILYYYGGEDDIRFRDQEYLDSLCTTWVFNRPYLYSLSLNPDGSEEDRKIADYFSFIPVVEEADTDNGPGGEASQEPPYVGRQDYEWTRVSEKKVPALSGPSVLDSSHIWATVNDGVNGSKIYFFNGSDWALQHYIDKGTEKDVYKVKVLDATHIWAFGTDCIFFFDGSNWALQADNVYSMMKGALSDLDASAPSDAWAVGRFENPIALHFNGVQWAPYDLMLEGLVGGYTVSEVEDLDSTHVWVVSKTGLIAFFDGNTWSEQYKAEQKIGGQIRGAELNSIFAANGSSVWALSNNQVYYFDGTEWKECFRARGNNHDFRYGSAIDSVCAWVAGKDEIYLFDGQGWTKQFDVVGNISEIKSLDASTVLVVLDDGSIYIGNKK